MGIEARTTKSRFCEFCEARHYMTAGEMFDHFELKIEERSRNESDNMVKVNGKTRSD